MHKTKIQYKIAHQLYLIQRNTVVFGVIKQKSSRFFVTRTNSKKKPLFIFFAEIQTEIQAINAILLPTVRV